MSNTPDHQEKKRTQGFPPVIDEGIRILILGSHPGVKSLQKRQYYGNPGNAFWRIVFGTLGVDDPVDYSKRLDTLLSHGIGLWDVYDTVEREGSLDVNIKSETLNDFERILGRGNVQLIIANGKAAFRETQQHLLFQSFEVRGCLSTSGLNNGREQERMEQWQSAIRYGLSKKGAAIGIRQINQKDYPTGKKVPYTYTSEKYYGIKQKRTENGWNFSITEESFAVPFVKRTEEEIFETYKEGSEVYLAEREKEEVGIMVMQYMGWNNTVLIHDLYVKEGFQQEGIGRRFLEKAKERARELGVRAIMLETQTSNYGAIQFYLKNGFEWVGFHTLSYSNEDVQNKEVRIEMGYRMEKGK